MKIYKLITPILFLFFLQNAFGQQIVDSLMHNGLSRNYRLYIPAAYANQTNLPLVFNLHGLTSNALAQQFYSKMNEVADTAGFIVCYPNGIDNSWNSGFNPNGVDDVGFINALIDELSTQYNIDLNRVYTCGMSNGGYQSYFLACELPNRFAAIASVTGTMFPSVFSSCNPQRSIPVLQFHGTNDSTVLYNGSATATAIEDVIKFWVDNNLCTAEGDTVNIPNIDTTDQSTAQLISYTNCVDNSAVQFYKILDGAHTWPGAATDFLGITNYDINASELIWNFFKQYDLESQILDAPTIDFIDINIQPNPANKFIYLDGIANTSTIKIINLDGRLVKTIENITSTNSIDISDLKAGLYLVNVFNNGKTNLGKLIVH